MATAQLRGAVLENSYKRVPSSDSHDMDFLQPNKSEEVPCHNLPPEIHVKLWIIEA